MHVHIACAAAASAAAVRAAYACVWMRAHVQTDCMHMHIAYSTGVLSCLHHDVRIVSVLEALSRAAAATASTRWHCVLPAAYAYASSKPLWICNSCARMKLHAAPAVFKAAASFCHDGLLRKAVLG
jgi:Tfp pilus assembly protein PilV